MQGASSNSTLPSLWVQVGQRVKLCKEKDILCSNLVSVTLGDTTTTQPSITVTSPNGGEIQAGSTHTVLWKSTNINSQNTVSIYLVGKAYSQLLKQTVNDGNEAITIPVLVPLDANPYELMVQATIDGKVYSGSSYFTIAGPVLPSPSITVLSPNGGERWVYNETTEISWISTGEYRYKNKVVDIFKGEDLVETIVIANGNDSNEKITNLRVRTSWVEGVNYKIKVTVQGTNASDFSNTYFTVTSPGALGDLVVDNVSWTPTVPIVSNTDPYLYVSFTVKNIGGASLLVPSGTKFSFYKDYGLSSQVEYGGLHIGTGAFVLMPGDSKSFSNVTTSQTPSIRGQAGLFDFTVVADASKLISEQRRDNNALTKSLRIVESTSTQPSITVSKNPSFSTPTYTAGSVEQRIGSYTLTASSAEDVNIPSITIKMGANAAQFQNLRVKIGSAYLGSSRAILVANASYPFYSGTGTAVNSVVQKGQTVTIDIYADISTSASVGTNSAIVTLTSCEAIGLTSINAIPCAQTLGQDVVIATGSLTAAIDASSSLNKIVTDNQTVTVGTLQFSALHDSFIIEELKFRVGSGASAVIGNTFLKDGINVLQSMFFIDDTVSFRGLSVPVEANTTSKRLTVALQFVDLKQVINVTGDVPVQLTMTSLKYVSSTGLQTIDTTPGVGDTNPQSETITVTTKPGV